MKNNFFIILILILSIIVTVGTIILLSNYNSKRNKRMSYDEITFLNDSLEMEYIKKQLESYVYDHSEIKDR
jgi:uncharacterized membrane protein